MARAYWAGGVAAGLVIIGFATVAPLLATSSGKRVDTVTTGSVAATATLASPPAPPVAVTLPVVREVDLGPDDAVFVDIPPQGVEGSPGFRAALDALADGDTSIAYTLASALTSEVERRTIHWAAIYFGRGAIDAPALAEFMDDAPDFAAAGVFRTRLEQALTKAGASSPEIIARLGGAMPKTVAAQIALARAYVADGQTARAARIATAIWVNNFLDPGTEKLVLARLGELLTPEAHWDRAVHLMMHDRARGVERLMDYLTPAQKTLAVARNAVSRNTKNAKALLDAVDPSLQSHSVYVFSRAQRALKFKLWDEAIAWLDKADGSAPDAAEFWYERRTMTRQLLALGEVKRAFLAADGYRNGPEGRQVEAHFHAGWIALAFLNEPKTALPHFEAMRKLSTLPDSITQSSYWMGRTKLALGDTDGAAAAYRDAARFRTVYYGQLARTALGLPATELLDMPDWAEAKARFEAREVVQAVRLFAANGYKDMALPLLRSFAFDLQDGGELLLAAQLAEQLGSHNTAIAIADTAERRGKPLDLINFPKNGLPVTRLASIDPAAVFAVARQESRFQLDAVSSAGARGLMQLMPATAKETAGKLGLSYSKSRLTSDGEYNALLGSTYLKAQLERFDGSLLLAAAAYNAGGGNVNKWLRTFGDPRDPSIDPVIWVELIPFQETRKYVQRVLGNYMVYRARLGKSVLPVEAALRKMPS
ncbi:lytic transglycosylase domain-containing protein [Devosia sp.]|uniref:lytic transglycosylase domain-containing protein n=1 Tax=Devosia sp. TaxID=1871048 RepID=UPI003A8E7CC6